MYVSDTVTSLDGSFLHNPIPEPTPAKPLDETPDNLWAPFEDRLSFDWAQYHYVKLQSSEREINDGLNLWLASIIKNKSNGDVPWNSAKELYDTIDSIQAGNTPWKTYSFMYKGPKPDGIAPQWMEQQYELNTRDILSVVEQQLATSEFEGKFDFTPYQEFGPDGERVWSNLMSGHWAWKEGDDIAQNGTATRGAMLVPVIAGSDKTTVLVATGHQEYHPVYASIGNISNTARCAHGNGVIPVAFLPIPKTSKCQRKKPAFQKFCRQLYHKCLEVVFSPLKPYMNALKVVRCPDGHFRRAVFSLGPYIADYPEQVWLSGIVSNWCPKCDSMPTNLDQPGSHRRTHEKTDFLLRNFDPGVLWDDFGIRSDIVPFTHSFPRANIHELLAPDLLHQLIKGIFKDHLVEWVGEYLIMTHGLTAALVIIEDIDHRISAVPPFPGLRRFPDGRDYNQWTGDDSKALMKVYLAAIAGYVPSAMVQAIAAFMEACYVARRNAISASALERFCGCVDRFHKLRDIFVAAGVRTSISLPCQHALFHYYLSIQLFGSPNGLCSSITESKHIKAALNQMLCTILRLEKMAALHQIFAKQGMMAGTMASYMARMAQENEEVLALLDMESELVNNNDHGQDNEDDEDDGGPIDGTPSNSLSDVNIHPRSEPRYPKSLEQLAQYICQPQFPLAFWQFIYQFDHPNTEQPPSLLEECPLFSRKIHVHHSALATFYSPSDICGAGGMLRERIRSSPFFVVVVVFYMVFVVLGGADLGLRGLVLFVLGLFFFFFYRPGVF
ncbi:hypothetical protein BYT27DRAFT_7227560 [Phlegmacium glaucopus]|nr:hypothetical protein BYT27DRAFT_7227560 [Phlegmacium glaucopus]